MLPSGVGRLEVLVVGRGVDVALGGEELHGVTCLGEIHLAVEAADNLRKRKEGNGRGSLSWKHLVEGRGLRRREGG